MSSSRYRYNRSDFGPLPVTLEHADISLNFLDGRVHGTIRLRLRAREPLDRIALDARELEIRSVAWADPPEADRPLAYDYRRQDNKLHITLPHTVETDRVFTIFCAATCTPSDHVLEGIYKDTTPPGAPRQYMSQCQQWGFPRILPIFDDCTAKCTMTTTLEADARYTHLISNGNICAETNPDGKPVPKNGDPSRQVIRFENRVPMAPYLFLACAGTWDVLDDEIVYPSGRRVKLEYLVPPGRRDGARVPMAILKESILWQGRTQEYEYPFDVYRTICMEKSNFGGMENVGNTTIVTQAALIDDYTNDQRLEYAHGIIVHEFEHNQCGSDVTMETPFDVWLNEAFTVDVERQFLHSQFDPDAMRLDEVDAVRGPTAGPLAVEDGGHMGRIVRDGFNDPDELIDGVTYVKAAEVIRMLRLVLGAGTFRKAKNLYFHRYRGANANTDQFFDCFEEVSGRELTAFKREWLYTIGYPCVEATYRYDAASRALTLTLTQTRTGRGGLFHVPIVVAAVNADGEDMPGTDRVVELTDARQDVRFENLAAEPAVLSLNRDYAFYGTFHDRTADAARLAAQIRLDTNAFNRVEAMRRLTDLERVRLIESPDAVISEAWFDVYGALLGDATLRPGLKAYLLRIDEQSMDRRYLPWYRERYRARESLLRAVARRFTSELTAAFESVDTYAPAAHPKDGVDERRLKGVLLRTLTAADTADTQRLAESHYRAAWNITDQVAALHGINLSHHPRRHAILNEAFERWRETLNGYVSYLSLVGASPHADVFDGLRAEEARPQFALQHPSHCRALFLPMSGNNKHLWTDAGLNWLTETVLRLAPVNETTANRLVASLKQVKQLADDLRPRVAAALRAMREGLDPAAAPSVAGRVRAYLEGLDDAPQ